MQKLYWVLFVTCVLSTIHLSIQQEADIPPIFAIKNKWNTGFQGEINVPITTNLTTWRVQFTFYGAVEQFESWTGKILSVEKGDKMQIYIFVNEKYNGKLNSQTIFKFEFMGGLVEGETDVPPLTVTFNGRLIYSNSDEVPAPSAKTNQDILAILNKITTTTTSTTTTTTKATTTIPFYKRTSNSSIIQIVPEVSDQDTEFILAEGSGNNPLSVPSTEFPNRIDSSTISVPEMDSTTKKTSPTTVTTKSTTPAPRPMPYDYKSVIHKSLLFYEAQRSGKLPPTNRIPWRGDSMLQDRGDNDEDLSGGYFDAGDHVKFAFPMTFSMTTVAWGLIEYWDGYELAGELDNALDCLKWGIDWILNAHPESNVFYGQVATGKDDHAIWTRPEEYWQLRQIYKITPRNPGSDLAAEASAALSAASIAFKKAEKLPYSNTTYIAKIKRHALELYTFADKFRKLYHMSIRDAAKYYKSTSYLDEITWAAAWLYRSTGNERWLRTVQGKYQNQGQFNLPYNLLFSWDDKTAGFQLLLAQMTQGKTQEYYKTPVRKYCQAVRDNRKRYTKKGLYFQNEWSPLRYSANVAIICLMAADLGIDTLYNLQFAKTQIHYMLGSTGRSYVVGFGRNFPKQPHHRGSSCPKRPQQCTFEALRSPKPNPHILQGALVGGPDINDKYNDVRKDFKNAEVTLDHNSCFQGAVAGLYRRAYYGRFKAINRTSEPWYVAPTTKPPAITTTKPSSGSAVKLSLFVYIKYLLDLAPHCGNVFHNTQTN